VFTKEKENQFPNLKHALSAINFAMERELDSILYYQEVKQFIVDKQWRAIDIIIAEERKHFALLAEVKRNYQ
jgi:rubrerythrin